jgi:hypothetical protein
MTSVSTAMEPVQLPVPPSPKKRRRAILAGLIIILLVVVVAASTGTYYLLTRNGPRSVSSSSVGTIAFVSSGKYSQINNLGVEDELQISLHNLAPPAAGKAYYAWLLGDNGASQTPPLLLGNGQLPVNNGTLDYLHPYDGQHNILLAHYSRFLITAEDANRIPTTPSSNSSAWRYYTEIPQTANRSIDSSTVLYELRTLLSGKPDDPTQWTIGGLVPRLVKSIESVQTLIDGARESWNSKNSTMLRQQIVSVLYYLDGTTNVQTDVSPAQKHTPIDEILAGTPLLDLSQGQGAMSYFLVTRNRLGILLTSPGISPTIKTGAQQALDALPDTQNWLRMMHDDAKNLLSMDDTALLQPSANSILSNMATEAHNAYDGPSTGTAKSGAMFIYTTVQSLLIFDVQACTKPSGEWRCASTSA